jgi:hypothetical protein
MAIRSCEENLIGEACCVYLIFVSFGLYIVSSYDCITFRYSGFFFFFYFPEYKIQPLIKSDFQNILALQSYFPKILVTLINLGYFWLPTYLR